MKSVIWDRNYTLAALVFTVSLFLFFVLVFGNRIVAPIWIPISLGVVAWYFYTLHKYSIHWQHYDSETFEKKLFWHSLIYRILFGIIMITVAELTWQRPFYVGARDAVAYHVYALQVAEHLSVFNFSDAFNAANFTDRVDDSGPAMLIGFVYIFTFGYYFSAVLLYTVLGAFTVVYLYKTAQIIWGEAIARLAGLMLMPFPLALFYSSVTLKEGIVTFLLMFIVYIMTRAINGLKVSVTQWSLLVVFLASLFFFRTPVGLGCVVLVTTAFLSNKYRGSYAASLLIGTFSMGAFFVFMYYLGEIDYFLDRASTASSVGQQRSAVLFGDGDVQVIGLSIMDLLLSPIYLAVSLLAPFPSFVEVATYHGTSFDQNNYNAPGRLVWNILAYFSVIGIWHTFKERDRLFSSLMVWGFTFGYMYILIATVTFTRERFAYIGMPLLLIFAAIGVYKTKNRLLWYVYLIGLVGIVLLWNALRLGVRGL